ncbi:MAG: hypothetical protein H7315_22755 [Herminiimonas sp.]|nr:hypothetical protein [Herminiimonas sp.]
MNLTNLTDLRSSAAHLPADHAAGQASQPPGAAAESQLPLPGTSAGAVRGTAAFIATARHAGGPSANPQARTLWNALRAAGSGNARNPHEPAVECNASGVQCMSPAIAVVNNGSHQVIHANRITFPAHGSQPAASYVAAQSPQPPSSGEDFTRCENFLLQGIESGQGLFQFVSRVAHQDTQRLQENLGNSPSTDTEPKSKERSVLHQLLSTVKNHGAPEFLIGGRYLMQNLEALVPRSGVEGAPSDHTTLILTVIDTNLPPGEAAEIRIPITEVGLKFTNSVLRPAEIARAKELLDAHGAHCSVPAADAPSSATTPAIVSYAGIGRNATLIVYDAIGKLIDSGEVNDAATLDESLHQMILEGRQQRGPQFVHSSAQLEELRNVLVTKLAERQRATANLASSQAVAPDTSGGADSMPRADSIAQSLQAQATESSPASSPALSSTLTPDPQPPELVLPESILRQPPEQPPLAQQPAVQQPAVQPPVEQPPVVQQPAVQQPAVQQPAVQQPAVQQPAVQPLVVQPPVVQPQIVQPPVVQPPVVQPPVVQPPVVPQQVAQQPVAQQSQQHQEPQRQQEPRRGSDRPPRLRQHPETNSRGNLPNERTQLRRGEWPETSIAQAAAASLSPSAAIDTQSTHGIVSQDREEAQRAAMHTLVLNRIQRQQQATQVAIQAFTAAPNEANQAVVRTLLEQRQRGIEQSSAGRYLNDVQAHLLAVARDRAQFNIARSQSAGASLRDLTIETQARPAVDESDDDYSGSDEGSVASNDSREPLGVDIDDDNSSDTDEAGSEMSDNDSELGDDHSEFGDDPDVDDRR